MERDLESMLIDYIDGKLNDADRTLVEQELGRNAGAYKLYEQLREVMQAMDNSASLEPGHELKSSFMQLLDREMVQQTKAKSIFFQPAFYRVAAAVTFLVMAGSIGYWITQNQAQQQELAALREQVEQNKQMMMAMLDNEQSASQRIMGVSVAYQMSKADEEIVKALVKTMNEDPNTNVRMAALEALSKFHTDPLVRKALIQSLVTQKDPVVQIALIQLMVVMQEKGAIKSLERMTKETGTMKAVKDEALAGIMRLS